MNRSCVGTAGADLNTVITGGFRSMVPAMCPRHFRSTPRRRILQSRFKNQNFRSGFRVEDSSGPPLRACTILTTRVIPAWVAGTAILVGLCCVLVLALPNAWWILLSRAASRQCRLFCTASLLIVNDFDRRLGLLRGAGLLRRRIGLCCHRLGCRTVRVTWPWCSRVGYHRLLSFRPLG